MSKKKPSAVTPAPLPKPPRAARPWMLLAFVLVSGAVLMSLEIVGSRVLAPHFGSTTFVWGSLISIVLGALAIGYKVGGHVADRWPHRWLLAAVGMAAGLMILIVPAAGYDVCDWTRKVRLGNRFGPLVSSLILFLFPSVFLGMVSPFAVKLSSRSVATIGNIAGTLYSLSTVGSIIGTLATAFFLIGVLGVKNILLTIALVQIGISAVLLVTSRLNRAPIAASAMAAGAMAAGVMLAVAVPMAAAPLQNKFARLVYETDSVYHSIRVVDAHGHRQLKFDQMTESTIQLDPEANYPPKSPFYTDLFHLAKVFNPDLRRVLIIGGGGGIGARQFTDPKYYPDTHVDMVEIDPKVVDVCRRFFYLGDDTNDRLDVHVEDGRIFVKNATAKYDLVILDAFTVGGQIPWHLTTREFMQEIRDRLTPNGLVLSNLITAVDGPKAMLLRSELLTYRAAFAQVYVFPETEGPREDRNTYQQNNVMMIGSNRADRLSPETIIQRMRELSERQEIPVADLGWQTSPVDLEAEGISLDGAVVLTDDFCPTDLYDTQPWPGYRPPKQRYLRQSP